MDELHVVIELCVCDILPEVLPPGVKVIPAR